MTTVFLFCSSDIFRLLTTCARCANRSYVMLCNVYCRSCFEWLSRIRCTKSITVLKKALSINYSSLSVYKHYTYNWALTLALSSTKYLDLFSVLQVYTVHVCIQDFERHCDVVNVEPVEKMMINLMIVTEWSNIHNSFHKGNENGQLSRVTWSYIHCPN